MGGGEERLAKVKNLKKLCMLSRALCLNKAGAYLGAVKACDYVLEEESQNAKALYRRARARLGLEDPQRALRDALAALALEPKSPEIRQLVAEAKVSQKAADCNAKDMCVSM